MSAQHLASWWGIGGGLLFGLAALRVGVGAWRGQPVGIRKSVERLELNWRRDARFPNVVLLPGGAMFVGFAAALTSANLTDGVRSGPLRVLGAILFFCFGLVAVAGIGLVFAGMYRVAPQWLYPPRHRNASRE